MYHKLIRPLLFLFNPEWIHRVIAGMLPLFFAIPGMAAIARKHYHINDPGLSRKVFGLNFPNTVGIAAGFDKEAVLYNSLANFGFGHIEIGTVTPRPQKGNPKPRLFRLPKDQALVNRMGFNNKGLDSFVRNLRKNRPGVIVGGNIGKNTLTPNDKATEDYCLCFEGLFDLVDYFVINVSCPNIKDLDKLQDKAELIKLLQAVQKINQSKSGPKPILLKISPDLSHTQLDEVLEIVQETRLDGIVATNTSTHREGLVSNPDNITRIGEGGLSGRPLKEKSTSTIAYLHRQSKGKIPIVGVGGIFDAEDALEKLQAGASLVQVYTGFIYNGPGIGKKINQGVLRKFQTSD